MDFLGRVFCCYRVGGEGEGERLKGGLGLSNS